MKIPAKPPPIHQARLSALPEDLGIEIRPEVRGEYLHWDELRRRTPPADIPHDEWWWMIAFTRRAIARALPLRDANGAPFRFVFTDSIFRMLHEIDRDASGRIELPEEVTNTATRDRYIVSSLIEEAITSSQLEGAATTRRVAQEMLRTGRTPRTKDERMIVNNFRAMELVRGRTKEPLNRELVLELHRVVTEDALDGSPDAAGRFRRPDEDVVVVDESGEVLHKPPRADTLPGRVDAMCAFANGEVSGDAFVHPVLRAVLIHFWLAYDHPFVDGNGRTARALFYWSMLRQGYWLTEFISISRVLKNAPARYARAFLYTETDDNDVTYFVRHQLDVIRRAIDDLHAYLRRKTREVRGLEQRLKGRHDLNHRQIALLGHALRHPDARYTIEAHQKSHAVVYQTARTDLLDLTEKDLLEQRKAGRKFVFVPVRGLEKKLGG